MNNSLDFCISNEIVKNPSNFTDYEQCCNCTESGTVEMSNGQIINFEGDYCEATITSENKITDEIIKFFKENILFMCPWDI